MIHQQIEEMAKEMCEEFGSTHCGNDCDCANEHIAKKLYKQGYRKIPQDAVVLTKEEYEAKLDETYEKGQVETRNDFDRKVVLDKEVYEIINHNIEQLNDANQKLAEQNIEFRQKLKQARKETAREIWERFDDFFRPFDKKDAISIDLLLTFLESVLKQNELEIEQ